MDFGKLNACIPGIDTTAATAAQTRLNDIAKPVGSLGVLEDLLVRLAGISGSAELDLGKRKAFVLAADNGVTAQGIAATPAEITAVMAGFMAERRSSVCLMAAQADIDVELVDMGMFRRVESAGIDDRHVACGTADISLGPAMTAEQCEQAIQVGIDLVHEAADRGYRLIATGEMGIGNTTTSSAIAAVLLGRSAAEVTGRGAGLDDATLAHKIAVIEQAIAVNGLAVDGSSTPAGAADSGAGGSSTGGAGGSSACGAGGSSLGGAGDSNLCGAPTFSTPESSFAFEALRKLGGFDIAGICGLCLGGALYQVPVIIDGFISGVAALVAMRLCPAAACALIPSHISAEPGALLVLETLSRAIGLPPIIHANMRLGEGTGAVALVPLLDQGVAVYRDLMTFADIGM